MTPTSDVKKSPNGEILRHFFGRLTIFLTLAHPLCGISAELESHPGISLEPMYSEAVIAYNAKQPAQAIQILDAVLKLKPDYVQALELKALIYKAQGKPAESRQTYEALIKNSPVEKAGPYHFELGIILYNAKKPIEAAPHFAESVVRGFNLDAAHFFLGLIHFNRLDRRDKLPEARDHFAAVAEGASAELRPAARYYLGLISYKNGYGSEGTRELIEARRLARDLPGSSIAHDIGKAVDAALAPYEKAQWFGSFSLLEAYNGNVSSLPNSATAPELTTGKRTVQTLAIAGFGRMSSPLDPWQWVGSYRGTYNFNNNSDTKTFEFLTHTLSLYFTGHPLARTQYGLKSEGTFTFSNQSLPQESRFQFARYSVSGELGPYLRHELRRGMQVTLEAYYRPQKFYTIADQTGSGVVMRATLAQDRGATWWNPTTFLALGKNRTDGETFRSWTADFGFSDLIRLGNRNTLNASATLTVNQYAEASPARYDKLLALRADLIHQLAPRWTVVGSFAYMTNYSNQSDFYYNQPVVSAGFGYSL